MIDEVKALRVEVTTALRERDTEREFRGAAEAAFAEQLARTEAAESALAAANARADEYRSNWVSEEARRIKADEALAAARRECEVLRDNLQWMVTLADHAESKDPHSPWCNGVHEGTPCEGDYQASLILDDARKALAAPGAAAGEEGTR